MICPRTGCVLSAEPPTDLHLSGTHEALKTCPRCRLSFWVPAVGRCIQGDNAWVAPLAITHLKEVCQDTVSTIGNFWMHPVEFGDLRKLGRDQYDLEMDPAHLAQGRWGSFVFDGRAVHLWTRRNIPEGLIYATALAAEFPLEWTPGDYHPHIVAITRY